MIILEKLYDCAERHLATEAKDWPAFAEAFKGVFDANVCIYRIAFAEDGQTPVGLDFIATTDAEFSSKYVEKEIHLLHPVKESSLTPMIPVRRSDLMNDEDFLNLGDLSDFLMEHGAFHFSTTPAILPDGSYLGLYTWRDRHQSDLSDVEIQRLALFMRHLMVMVDVSALIPIKPGGTQRQREAMGCFADRFKLTDTENRILLALLSGHAPRSIASQTDRSYGTVRWHIQNILEKCGVNSQKELFRAFFQNAE